MKNMPIDIEFALDQKWETGLNIQCVDCGQWYEVRQIQYTCKLALLPREISLKFITLERDSFTDEFLHGCLNRNRTINLLKDCYAGLLRARFSLTDANSLAGRGDMFVLSTRQACTLLGLGEHPGGILLDVGAGNGDVTSQLAPLFDTVLAIEVSIPMQKRLMKRGFVVLGIDMLDRLNQELANLGLHPDHSGLECIALLNILDRCDCPISLLRDVRAQLKPHCGRCIIAVALPFRPFVEKGIQQVPPTEFLPLSPSASWEESVSTIWNLVLRPAGFDLLAVSRAPYLCKGDFRCPIYSLDDAIFVLRRSENV